MKSNQTHAFSCILLGSQSLMIQCGEILQTQGHEIRAVVSREPAIVQWTERRNLRLIDPESIAGRIFCSYCQGPFAMELLNCPHCGAPAEQSQGRRAPPGAPS